MVYQTQLGKLREKILWDNYNHPSDFQTAESDKLKAYKEIHLQNDVHLLRTHLHMDPVKTASFLKRKYPDSISSSMYFGGFKEEEIIGAINHKKVGFSNSEKLNDFERLSEEIKSVWYEMKPNKATPNLIPKITEEIKKLKVQRKKQGWD